MSNNRLNRNMTLLVVATLVAVLVTIVLGIASIRYLDDQSAALSAQQRSDQITACRSEYADRREEAEAVLDQAESERDDVVFRAMQAIALDDDAAFQEALSDSYVVEQHVAVARTARNEALLDKAEMTTLSRTDPDEFLDRCEREFG